MPNKWCVKNALTIEERRKIKEAIDLGLSYREMALFVGRPKTTVTRESKRLGKYTEYDPEKAQKDFEKKQIDKQCKLLKRFEEQSTK